MAAKALPKHVHDARREPDAKRDAAAESIAFRGWYSPVMEFVAAGAILCICGIALFALVWWVLSAFYG